MYDIIQYTDVWCLFCVFSNVKIVSHSYFTCHTAAPSSPNKRFKSVACFWQLTTLFGKCYSWKICSSHAGNNVSFSINMFLFWRGATVREGRIMFGVVSFQENITYITERRSHCRENKCCVWVGRWDVHGMWWAGGM